MSQRYGRKYTIESITVILNRILGCIRRDRYTIAANSNRAENQKLIREYNLHSSKQKQILLGIKPNDFCYSVRNKNSGYGHETLYVFCPTVMLFNIDDEELPVDLYIKFNIIEHGADCFVIVVSFHKRKKPISFCFR